MPVLLYTLLLCKDVSLCLLMNFQSVPITFPDTLIHFPVPGPNLQLDIHFYFPWLWFVWLRFSKQCLMYWIWKNYCISVGTSGTMICPIILINMQIQQGYFTVLFHLYSFLADQIAFCFQHQMTSNCFIQNLLILFFAVTFHPGKLSTSSTWLHYTYPIWINCLAKMAWKFTLTNTLPNIHLFINH